MISPPALPLAAALALAGLGASASTAQPNPGNPAQIEWQTVGRIEMARTETTVAQFRRYVQATQAVTQAERQGGGEVYESGWVKKPGWTWRTPMGGGHAAADDEPAVHITHPEAQAFCRWAGARLPTDAEWLAAAYTEQRETPAAPFVRGKTYPYPSGDSPLGAQCLGDCGPQAAARAQSHGARLWRGAGPARVSSTPAGVNGLHDMGANAWEWVDEPQAAPRDTPRRTRGGSWWYGAAQMKAEHLQSKPPDTAVVYIGFRCARGG